MRLVLLYILLFFVVTPLTAQKRWVSCEEIENLLIKSYSKLLYYYDTHQQDSLLAQNSEFFDSLKFYTKYYPETLSYPFKKLKDSTGVFIASSKDSLYRIYSWDTWRGGTWRMYENIYQFKSKGEVRSVYMILDFQDSAAQYPQGSLYSEIFSFTHNDTTYYLAVSNDQFSGKDCKQKIEVSFIAQGKINDIKLFKTKTGVRNILGFSYDFFSVADRPERPLKLIRFDEETKTVNIPVVLEGGKVTDRFIRYQFTGSYFEKIDVKKN